MKWKTKKQRLEYYRKWREKNREKLRQYQRGYYRRHHSHCREYFKNYMKNHRKERNVKSEAERAVKNGEINKESCVICKNPNAEIHHEDYSKPLEVVWLCRSCHKKLHLGQLVKEINDYLKRSIN